MRRLVLQYSVERVEAGVCRHGKEHEARLLQRREETKELWLIYLTELHFLIWLGAGGGSQCFK